uniref:Mediator of RNA polymerase II transcription subunit 29 n=1 Tax=Cynoglossus semilaevis TaxID=244447 RepID=A0A3P8WS16_CYNSE
MCNKKQYLNIFISQFVNENGDRVERVVSISSCHFGFSCSFRMALRIEYGVSGRGERLQGPPFTATSMMTSRTLRQKTLTNVMKIASLNLAHNTTIDNGTKSSDSSVQRFDKSLEEFYALCDQLELCLRLAYECLSQSIDSAKHSPNLVPTATKPDTVQTESMSYAQYLCMIKSQISCAKDIHNALLECSKKIAGKGQPPGMM